MQKRLETLPRKEETGLIYENFSGTQAESTVWWHKQFIIKKLQIKKEKLRQ